ncbi:unnamed protein product [Parajaminaea phylloscopi]
MVLIISVLNATMMILFMARSKDGAILMGSASIKAVLGLFVALQIFLALFSLLGLIGAIARKPGLVRAFAVAFLIAWLGGFALGLGHVINGFRTKEAFLQRCQARQEQKWAGSDFMIHFAQRGCHDAFKLFMGVFIALWVLFHLIGLYFVVVAHQGASAIRQEIIDEPYEPKIPPAPPSSQGRADGRRYGRADQGPARKGSDASYSSSSSTLPVIDAGTKAKDIAQSDERRHSGDLGAAQEAAHGRGGGGGGGGGGDSNAMFLNRYNSSGRGGSGNRQQSLDDRLAAGASSAGAWGRVSLSDDNPAPKQAKFSWRTHE